MEVPKVDIDGCARAHQRLRVVAGGFADDDISRPSKLGGWTVGHVLTHLARNSEAMCRRIEAAARGEIVDQYAGGAAGRDAEIDAGAARAAREIELDVVVWSDRLDDLFGSLPDGVWDRPVRTVGGREHPASLLPFRRWREVEVHLVDLDAGLSPRDWPQEFVDRALPGLMAGLPDRADRRHLTAGLFDRGPAPDLDTWG